MLKRTLVLLLAISLGLSTISCGTLLHPERIGQRSTGRLDTSIVVLNSVGLLLFFIPGLIAFGVDFYNGTIYLPPDCHTQGNSVPSLSENETVRGQSPGGQEWNTIRVNPKEMNARRIEAIVREQTGQPVTIDPAQLSRQLGE